MEESKFEDIVLGHVAGSDIWIIRWLNMVVKRING